MRSLQAVLSQALTRETRSRELRMPIEFEPLTVDDRIALLEREAARTRRTLEVVGGLLAFFFILGLLGRR